MGVFIYSKWLPASFDVISVLDQKPTWTPLPIAISLKHNPLGSDLFIFLFFEWNDHIFFWLTAWTSLWKKKQPFNKSTHKPVIILSHNRHSAQEKLPHSVSRSGPPVIPESYIHHSAVANYSPECSCNKSSGCLDAVTQVTCSKLL